MDKVVLSLSNPLEDAKNTITTSTVQFSFFTLYTDSTQGCTKISRYRVFIYLIVGNWKATEFFWLDFPLVPWWKLQGIMPIVANETVTDEFSYFYHDKTTNLWLQLPLLVMRDKDNFLLQVYLQKDTS